MKLLSLVIISAMLGSPIQKPSEKAPPPKEQKAPEVKPQKPQPQPAKPDVGDKNPVVVNPEKPATEGKVQTVPREKVHKHDKPILEAPAHRPPPRPGGSWHWHGHYHRWMWFEVNRAPRTIIVPADYALPPQVIVYEQPMRTATIICPHCNQPITVQVP